MGENSPTFQRWDSAPGSVSVPKGRLRFTPSAVPSGLRQSQISVPNVETLGYSRLSLRDKGLSWSGAYFMGSNPSGIGASLRARRRSQMPQDRRARSDA